MTWFPECDNDPTGEALKKQQQTLTFYELDLGLNHVVRKYAEPLADPGNLLVPGARLKEKMTVQKLSFFWK